MFSNNKLNEEQLNQIEEKKKTELHIPLNYNHYDFLKDDLFSDKIKNKFVLDFLKPNFLNEFKLFNDSLNKIDFNIFNQNKNNIINNLSNQNNSFIFPSNNNNININKNISLDQDTIFKINSDINNNNEETNNNNKCINNNNTSSNKSDVVNIIKNNIRNNFKLNNEQIGVNNKNNGLLALKRPKFDNTINFNINNSKNYLFPPIGQLSMIFQNENNYLFNPKNNVLNDNNKL